ncbi:transporter [Polaribacter sp. SA4-12]|uniref:transporter n=1 Tax=Polaribacter sp. SA4-12 TaxID=1312072 RepID=UPI000B3D26EB|nr:transporter [Polaribacter sp. SA4-12]ARV14910.1 hypothetical protein BTO07_07015 [Polaribacter sp. SA4-12]
MKHLFTKLFLVFLFIVTNSIQAQYTDVINSNKPGFSESPYSVGTGVYQFETNFFLRDTSIEPTFSMPQSFGIDLLFRTSFFLEKLELNAQLTYQRDKVAFKNIFTSHYFTSGLSKFTIGAKYLLFQPEYTDKTKEVRSWKRRNAFDKKRLIPSVAIYLGMNTDLVNDIYKTESITPKVGVLLQHNLTNEFNVISNVYYDKIGTDFSEISYIITATQNFGSRWSGFLEHQGIFQKYQNNVNFGTGLAYLFSKDFQINTSARYLLEGKASGFYGSLGISYRINKHQDAYTDLDEVSKQLKDTPITRYNAEQRRGFFSRILNIFKKKDKNTTTRKRATRTRKSTTKKKKSGFLGLFSKKKKKEETEIEKLEREIKELEKEVEKDNK